MTVGLLSLGSAAAASGHAQINTSSNDLFGGVLNAMNTAFQLAYNNGASPSQTDANGYPSSALTSTQEIAFLIGFVDSQTGPSTSWVFKWTPPGNAVLFFNGAWSNVVSSGCSVTGSGNTTVTMTAGTPARVTFTWTSLPGQSLLVKFQAAAYAAGSPQIVLCRASDEAAITAGQIFTSEYISAWAGIKPRTIRTMPWINSGSLADTNQSKWSYRSTLNSLGFTLNRFPPGAWGGTASGTNQYTCSLPTDSSSSGWANGEVIQCNVTNPSSGGVTSITGAVNNGSGLVRLTVGDSSFLATNQQVYISSVSGTVEANGVQTVTVIDSTHIDLQGVSFVNAYQNSAGGLSTQSLTVTGKTGGTKFIAFEAGQAIGAAFSSTTMNNGLSTFVYNSLLNVVMVTSDGIYSNVPIEAQINLAHTLAANLWVNIPTYDDGTYAASMAAFIRDNLRTSLNCYFEYSNETWNSGFPQFAYCINMGNVLNGISGHGFYSLRVRQMMASITTTWTASRSQSSLVRVIAWQAFGDPSTTSNRLNSSELNAGTNAKLLAYAGNVNYTVQGQRAVDFCDSGSYATYYSGGAFTNGFSGSYTTDTGNIAVLQAWATAFNSNPNDATSLAQVDNDFRQGTNLTKAISSVSGTTINMTSNGYSNGNIGVFTVSAGGTVYTGVSLNTPYYVVSAATNSFSVAATNGGSAISLSGGSGTISFGILAGQTMLDLSRQIYQNVGGNTSANPGWEQVAATYDAYRTGVSQAKLWIECYEGALEAKAPTTAQCTSMNVLVGGSAATASAALAAGLLAYKTSAAASTLALAQFKQFMGTDSSQPLTFGLQAHSKTPSWFLLVGPSQWSLLQSYVGSSVFTTYNGVASF